MDVINCISKEPGFPDVPVTDPEQFYQFGFQYKFNGPKVHEYLSEMHEKVLQHYPGAFTVGETPGIKVCASEIRMRFNRDIPTARLCGYYYCKYS